MHTAWTSISSSVRKWVKFGETTVCIYLISFNWLILFLSQGAYMRNDVFEDTAALCQRVNKQVAEVFSSPETVMAKLIQNIFENKLQVRFQWSIVLLEHFFIFGWLFILQAHVKEKLDGTRHSDAEQYLKNLYDLYTRWFGLFFSNLVHFNSRFYADVFLFIAFSGPQRWLPS